MKETLVWARFARGLLDTDRGVLQIARHTDVIVAARELARLYDRWIDTGEKPSASACEHICRAVDSVVCRGGPESYAAAAVSHLAKAVWATGGIHPRLGAQPSARNCVYAAASLLTTVLPGAPGSVAEEQLHALLELVM